MEATPGRPGVVHVPATQAPHDDCDAAAAQGHSEVPARWLPGPVPEVGQTGGIAWSSSEGCANRLVSDRETNGAQ